MAKYLQLQIPTACGEDWKGMTPGIDGRFCGSCRKTVVDFTAMSDAEIVRYLQKAEGPVCGRLAAAQLNRDLPVPKKPWPWVHTVFRFTLPAFLLSFTSKGGEGTSAAGSIVITPIKPVAATAEAVQAPVDISGQIIGEEGLPLPGASIRVKGSRIGTSTDTAGRFTLKVKSSDAELLISYVGYISREVKASYFAGRKVALKLEQVETDLMGDVIIMGMIAPSHREKLKRKEIMLREQKKADTASKADSGRP